MSHPASAAATPQPPTTSAPLPNSTTLPPTIVPSRIARNVPASIERVAGDELVLAQMLRQQRVLDRSEHGRVRAETEERREEQRNAAVPQSPAPERHDADLGDLHPARDRRLVDPIGERARGAGEQEERRDEQGAGEHHERGRVEARCSARR